MNPEKHALRADLPTLPQNMADLYVDDRGYPVPAFVCYIDGKPDFRVADSEWKETARAKDLCYVCGKAFTTRHRWYVIGPMCAINRTIGEPAVHRECAVFSAQGCPFLARPHMVRREAGLPDGHRFDEAGLKGNPGVTALYETREAKVFRRTNYIGDYLLFLGDPNEVQWYKEGRPATLAEVGAAMEAGLPNLVTMALEEGVTAVMELHRCMHRAYLMLPPRDPKLDFESDKHFLAMGMMIGKAVKELMAKQAATHSENTITPPS